VEPGQPRKGFSPVRQDAEPGFTSRKKGTRDDHGNFHKHGTSERVGSRLV
jgi:hypothetical protein